MKMHQLKNERVVATKKLIEPVNGFLAQMFIHILVRPGFVLINGICAPVELASANSFSIL
jgi:hypothetical protein